MKSWCLNKNHDFNKKPLHRFDKFGIKVVGKINKFLSNGTLARRLPLVHSVHLTSVLIRVNYVFERYSPFIWSRHHVVIRMNDYEHYQNSRFLNYWIKNLQKPILSLFNGDPTIEIARMYILI